MFPLFMLAVAFGIVFVVLLFYAWRHVDRRVKLAYADETAGDLKVMLEQALEQQQHLIHRVEHLEAIVASESWDAPSRSDTPPLAAPDADTSTGEKASPPARRQLSR